MGWREMMVRRATEGDIDNMRKLFRDTVLHVATRDYSAEQVHAWAQTIDDFERNERLLARIERQYFIVAEIDGELVGFASLERNGYVDLLYVHKDHQREGIGKTLYDAIEAEARRVGLNELRSDVSLTACSFFERCGFHIIDEQEVRVDGVALPNLAMKKKWGKSPQVCSS